MKKEILEIIYQKFKSSNEIYSDLISNKNDKFLKFKTGGIRALMKEGFDGINETTTNIIATVLALKFKSIVIGFDHRVNSDRFAYIIYKICRDKNREIKIYKHCTTPYLAW